MKETNKFKHEDWNLKLDLEFWNFGISTSELIKYQSPGQYGKTSKDVRLTTRRFAWRNDIEGKEFYRIEPEMLSFSLGLYIKMYYSVTQLIKHLIYILF